LEFANRTPIGHAPGKINPLMHDHRRDRAMLG
jgi:hypothetical protein